MKTRERVLIVLMVSAVGYGALHYLTMVHDSLSAEDTPASTDKLTLQFVKESHARIESCSLNAHAKYAEEQIVAPWLINPFAEGVAVAVVKMVAVAPVTYTGYMDVDGQLFALINGRSYKKGCKLADSTYSILSIESSRVVLNDNKSNKTVIVEIKDE